MAVSNGEKQISVNFKIRQGTKFTAIIGRFSAENNC